jgi:hypothetical protein
MLTLVLQAAGYRTVYLNEALTEGLAPEGLKEYVTQRARWCLGLMQIARGGFGPFADNRLRLRDRWSVIDSVFFWLTTFSFRLAAMTFPLLYWFFNITVVDASVADVVRYFGPYIIWVLFTLNFVSGGLIIPIVNDVSQLLGAIPITRAAIVGLIRPKGHPFSDKSGSAMAVDAPVPDPDCIDGYRRLAGHLHRSLCLQRCRRRKDCDTFLDGLQSDCAGCNADSLRRAPAFRAPLRGSPGAHCRLCRRPTTPRLDNGACTGICAYPRD